MAHTGEGIAGLCGWLHELSGGHPASVHVAIEVPHGAVVEMLLERDVQVYAINPKQLDRFRDRFSASGAKDDRRDARVLADSLRTDGRSFRQVQVQSPQVIELREWSRMAEELQQDRNRLTNRIREQLRRYYPQMVELGKGNNGKDIDAALVAGAVGEGTDAGGGSTDPESVGGGDPEEESHPPA